MKIKSIHEGATVRLARTGDVLKIGDDVGRDEAIRVEGGPAWPAHAVTFEDEGAPSPFEIGGGRIGSDRVRGMVIG